MYKYQLIENQANIFFIGNQSKSKDFKIETVPAPGVVSCKESGRESVMETVVLRDFFQ